MPFFDVPICAENDGEGGDDVGGGKMISRSNDSETKKRGTCGLVCWPITTHGKDGVYNFPFRAMAVDGS